MLSNTNFRIIQYSVFKTTVEANPHPDADTSQEAEINGESSEETVLQERPLNNSRSIKQRPKTFHQESLTKDEARKRMLSWRKTTQPRVRRSCNRSKSEDQG